MASYDAWPSTQGMNAAFHFLINMWEILMGIVDMLIAAVTTVIASMLSPLALMVGIPIDPVGWCRLNPG